MSEKESLNAVGGTCCATYVYDLMFEYAIERSTHAGLNDHTTSRLLPKPQDGITASVDNGLS